jgi:hypothetical protein
MSKGVGKLQTAILGLLRGEIRKMVYGGCGDHTTPELVDELLAHGILNADKPRRQHLWAILRACDSLARRELLDGKYVYSDDQRCEVVMWSLKGETAP